MLSPAHVGTGSYPKGVEPQTLPRNAQNRSIGGIECDWQSNNALVPLIN